MNANYRYGVCSKIVAKNYNEMEPAAINVICGFT